MIRILMVSIILISSILAEEISIGSKIPGADYFLKNVDGKESTLSAFKKENGLPSAHGVPNNENTA